MGLSTLCIVSFLCRIVRPTKPGATNFQSLVRRGLRLILLAGRGLYMPVSREPNGIRGKLIRVTRRGLPSILTHIITTMSSSRKAVMTISPI